MQVNCIRLIDCIKFTVHKNQITVINNNSFVRGWYWSKNTKVRWGWSYKGISTPHVYKINRKTQERNWTHIQCEEAVTTRITCNLKQVKLEAAEDTSGNRRVIFLLGIALGNFFSYLTLYLQLPTLPESLSTQEDSYSKSNNIFWCLCRRKTGEEKQILPHPLSKIISFPF